MGGREWAQCGGMRGWGSAISTKSVPYDTHSHGLCLDSLFLSISPPLSLSEREDEGKEVGVREG